MAQSRFGSFVETFINMVIGFAINWSCNMLILPLFGFASLTGGTALEIGLVFTVVSLVRQYILRRFFNGLRFGNQKS